MEFEDEGEFTLVKKEEVVMKPTSIDEENKSAFVCNPEGIEYFNQLPPEEQERYRKLGEQMYCDIDFKATHEQGIPVYMDGSTVDERKLYESAAYIVAGLNSGLSADSLNKLEKETMEKVYGKNWKDKYDMCGESEEETKKEEFEVYSTKRDKYRANKRMVNKKKK